MDRRSFLATTGALAALPTFAGPAPSTVGRVTLLHTNDTHSRIEPFPAGSGAQTGKGGIARRATLVKQLREELKHVLLLDAGDVFQGTPYFNRYKGRLDYQLMSMVGYDAATLGNHDFDNGVEALLDAMEEAKFPFVNCNFKVDAACGLSKRLQPWLIREFPGVKVGITGVGVDFKGLVAPKHHEGVIYRDPVASLRPVVEHLRRKEKVDLVVVLSHLGYDLKGSAIDDLTLARQVEGIDALIGGHSHTFLEQPTVVGQTHIFQVGFGGAHLGRMDFVVDRGKVKAAHGRPMDVRS